MDTERPLLVDRADGVVTLTINRPARRNAITAELFQQLDAALVECTRRADDRVIVLTGSGDAFSSGADLSEGSPPDLSSMRWVGETVVRLHRMPKPTIARVRGPAAGLGCSLALGCDLIVASDTARFGMTFSKVGLSLDGGASFLLPRLVGIHRAKQLAFFGDVLDASDAAALGLVNVVVPDGELDAVVESWASRLAAGPPIALSMTKLMLNDSFSSSMAEAAESEARAQSLNLKTRDTMEAMRAFVEKRPPVFEGR